MRGTHLHPRSKQYWEEYQAVCVNNNLSDYFHYLVSQNIIHYLPIINPFGLIDRVDCMHKLNVHKILELIKETQTNRIH